MSLIVGVGDFGIGDLVNQATAAQTGAQQAQAAALTAAAAVQEGHDLGPWNVATNTPALSASSSAVIDGGYYSVTVAGNAPFGGTNFLAGQAFAVGDRIAKIGTAWYRRPFAISNGAELAVVGSTPNAIMNRTAVSDVVKKSPLIRQVSTNLFNRDSVNIQTDRAVNGGGAYDIAIVTGWKLSDYMAVVPGEQYTFSGYGYVKAVQFADANKVKISGLSLTDNSTQTVTIPANCYFMVFTVKTNADSVIPATFQVEKGTVATAYNAYSTVITALSGNEQAVFEAGTLKDGATLTNPGSGQTAVMNRQAVQALLPTLTQVPGKNLFNRNSTAIQTGKAVSLTTFDIIAATNWSLSDYVAVVPGQQVTFSGQGYQKAVQYCDVNKAKLSGAVLTDNVNTTVTIPANCYFIIFTVKIAADTAIPTAYQVEPGPVATAYAAYALSVSALNGAILVASQLADGVKLPNPGTGPTDVPNRSTVQSLIPALGIKLSRNLFNRNSPNIQADKGVNATNTSGDIVAATGYQLSDYLAVVPGEVYTFSGHGYSKAVQFADANKTKISGAILTNATNTTVTIPANCYYIIYTVKANGDPTIPVTYQVEKSATATPYVAYLEQVESVGGKPLAPYYHPSITGQKLVIMGDSISTQVVEGTNQASDTWPNYIRFPYWGSVFNCATNGARIKDDMGVSLTSRQLLSYQIQYAIDNNQTPDVIGIFMGTNDLAVNNIGDYTVAMGKANLTDLDRSNVYEALRYAYWKITTQWPNAKVFHATPLQRADRTLEVAKTISDCIRKMAPNYCVRIIDAEGESGIIKQYEVPSSAGRYLYDGLHPNPAGRQLIADFYMRKMIPVLI